MPDVKTAESRIISSTPRELTSLEKQVEQAFNDLEANNSDFAVALHGLRFISAVQLDVADGKTAIIIMLPPPTLRTLQESKSRIYGRLIGELEKRCSGSHVFFVAKRRILKKPTRKFCQKQMRPRSRTLTAVHDNVLTDIVFPTEIVGKRIRINTNGSLIKVHLDKKDRSSLEGKLDSLSQVYKKLTGKNVIFQFALNNIGTQAL